MAINLDRNLLTELGLGSLPDEEGRALLGHIYETLEMRVGMRLADQMTNEQLDEFEKYFEAKDEAGAFHWLETNFPNYKEIVQDEFNKLKEEVRQAVPQILQSAQNPQPAGSAPPPPAPTSPPIADQTFAPPTVAEPGPAVPPPAPDYPQPPVPPYGAPNPPTPPASGP